MTRTTVDSANSTATTRSAPPSSRSHSPGPGPWSDASGTEDDEWRRGNAHSAHVRHCPENVSFDLTSHISEGGEQRRSGVHAAAPVADRQGRSWRMLESQPN